MFSFLDHICGAIDVRANRFFLKTFRKPDATLISNNIFLGGVNDIDILDNIGINAILDLREEVSTDLLELKKHSISFLNLKIKDRTCPTNEQAIQAIQYIHEILKKNEKIFVHCNLGRGRAPLILCLYLISTGMKNHDAILLIKSKRRYVFLNKIQLTFLENFEKQYSHK